MGLSLRTRSLLNIQVPSVVWKPLVGAAITMDDIEAIDVLSINALKQLDSKESVPVDMFNSEMSGIKFSVMGADSKMYPLKPGGEEVSLNYSNRLEYSSLTKQFRISEFKKQVSAIRRGLGKVVPLQTLAMFGWRELETMVCGRGFESKDVDLLMSKTQYNGPNPTDQYVQWFWDILRNDFTDDQRGMYLTFAWGRSRMPLTAAEFDTPHKLAARAGGNAAFPMAHTCFFQTDLPAYTSREVMLSRLSAAISMCGVIDGD